MKLTESKSIVILDNFDDKTSSYKIINHGGNYKVATEEEYKNELIKEEDYINSSFSNVFELRPLKNLGSHRPKYTVQYLDEDKLRNYKIDSFRLAVPKDVNNNKYNNVCEYMRHAGNCFWPIPMKTDYYSNEDKKALEAIKNSKFIYGYFVDSVVARSWLSKFSPYSDKSSCGIESQQSFFNRLKSFFSKPEQANSKELPKNYNVFSPQNRLNSFIEAREFWEREMKFKNSAQ